MILGFFQLWWKLVKEISHNCCFSSEFGYLSSTLKISSALYVVFPSETLNDGGLNGGRPAGMSPVRVKGSIL